MTTPAPTPEAIEAAAEAIFNQSYPNNPWSYAAGYAKENFKRYATAALTAAAPFIAAQAKAEAWDEVIARIDLGTPHMVDEKYVAGAVWVRDQITDVLKAATIEGKSE